MLIQTWITIAKAITNLMKALMTVTIKNKYLKRVNSKMKWILTLAVFQIKLKLIKNKMIR